MCWWGEAPDLPQSSSKAPVVAESVVAKRRKAAEPRPSVRQ